MNNNLVNIQQGVLNFKIILLGDSNVGKTCFIKQFMYKEFQYQTKPTISIDFVTKTYQIDQFCVRLNVFDTAGQERFKSLTKTYFKGADAVLFMYSLDNKQSFNSIQKWIKFYEQESENKNQIRVLVGTKKDLKNEMTPKDYIKKDEIKDLVQRNQFTFKFETSAKQNVNINLVFEQLSRNLIYNRIKKKINNNCINKDEWPSILKRDKDHLLTDDQKKKGCC